jgi:hypothetical protein
MLVRSIELILELLISLQDMEHTEDDDDEWIDFYRRKKYFPSIDEKTVAKSISMLKGEVQHLVRQSQIGPILESIKTISSELEQAYSLDYTSTLPLGDMSTESQLAKLIESKDWTGLGEFSTREEIVNERELQSIEARRLLDADFRIPYWNFAQIIEGTTIHPEDSETLSVSTSESN